MIPFFTYVFSLIYISKCYELEINLTNKLGSNSIKIICGPADEKYNLQEEHNILWEGSQFGMDDQQKLINKVKGDALVPNITVNSSDRHRCYLLTPKNKTMITIDEGLQL